MMPIRQMRRRGCERCTKDGKSSCEVTPVALGSCCRTNCRSKQTVHPSAAPYGHHFQLVQILEPAECLYHRCFCPTRTGRRCRRICRMRGVGTAPMPGCLNWPLGLSHPHSTNRFLRWAPRLSITTERYGQGHDRRSRTYSTLGGNTSLEASGASKACSILALVLTREIPARQGARRSGTKHANFAPAGLPAQSPPEV